MAASAAAVCMGTILAACGADGPGGGYVAVGAAGGSPRTPGTAAPTEDVTLVPLDGAGAGAGESGDSGGYTRSDGSGGPGNAGSSAGPGPGPGNAPGQPGSQGGGDPGGTGTGTGIGTGTGTGNGTTAGGSSGAPDSGGRTSPGSGSSHAPSAPSPPSGGSGRTTPPAPPAPPAPAPAPAELSAGDPVRQATDRRWCEKVTVAFRNFGGTAVRSGTVTLGTHIIGALGIDWATVESTEELPAPIGAGTRKDGSWTVCVDAWQVPLGMHIETRDVSVQWK